MAQQFRRVTGNTSTRSTLPQAMLQSRIGRLPQMLAAQQQKEQLARDTQYQNQQLSLQNKSMQQRKREQEVGMGLEATKLGFTTGMSDWGGKTIGDTVSAFKSGVNTTAQTLGKSTPIMNEKTSGLPASVSNFNIGGGLASGLTGYGVGKMVGGKSKVKKGLFGAGAGALMGLLSAKPGSGTGWGSALTGSLFGGLGGYFS